MECIYPHCAGTLRTGLTTGFCTTCRLPVSACQACGAWARAFAVFCRQCGQTGTVWQREDPVEPEALRSDPRRSALPQPINTTPQAASGFLWAMGEGGDLFRVNPYARPGEQVEVHDRFWAEPQTHAFCVRRLAHPFSTAANADRQFRGEHCAVVATADRLLISSLFSKARRSLSPLSGESFLVNAREHFQLVEADEDSLYILSRYGDQISLVHADLGTAEVRRLAVGYGTTPLCGPVLITDVQNSHIVIWSDTALWVYTGGQLTPVILPEAVQLITAPSETGLRLPPGRSPAITSSGQLFLAATQFGRPALLRLFPGPTGWSTTVIPLSDEGTLSQTTTGQPLLSTAGRLLTCIGPAFRTSVQDPQIATRLPAWGHAGLTLFFCEADYQGLKQWLKANFEGNDVPISWNLSSGTEVQACEGFWATGTALCTICVLAERGLRTEFLSWCV